MPKVDMAQAKVRTTNVYPPHLKKSCEGRHKTILGDAVGLTQFGVNLTRLPPGVASALRHWHEQEDEFVYVVEGELVLVESDGETVLKPGDAAGWKANAGDGHMLVNRTSRDAVYLEIGTRAAHEYVHYPDEDLVLRRDDKGTHVTRKNGEPY